MAAFVTQGKSVSLRNLKINYVHNYGCQRCDAIFCCRCISVENKFCRSVPDRIPGVVN
jgi:hypothetical protein